MDKTCTSLDRQNLVLGELLKKNCPSPSYTKGNVPKELTSTSGIAGFENAWRHGCERKDF